MNTELIGRAAKHAALADPARLAIVDALLLSDASPSELQRQLSMPSNLLAHHLRVLQDAGLVLRSRSRADRRRTYLHLVAAAEQSLLSPPDRRVKRVLFVCSENSARSQLAAALWNRRSTIPAVCAGLRPAAEIDLRAVAAARRRGLRIPASAPRRFDDVWAAGDLVVAVCDNAHEELPADTHRIHWSVPDPVRAGSDDAFDRALDDLTDRIERLAPNLNPARKRSP